MSVEKKRGCGYRKVGGKYLVSDGPGVSVDWLPFPLDVCPTCSVGFKPALGWTWVDTVKLLEGTTAPKTMGRAGLLWIGTKFYKTPAEFIAEGVSMGFSRRIRAIPQKFEIGKTWVLLAHKNAIDNLISTDGLSTQHEFKPGIFFAWQPSRIEQIFKESDRGSEAVQAAEKRGITAVFVPDSDPDHQGNVHDDFTAEQKAKREAEDADSE